MLISHSHKFIFTKTRKTASSTTASFFTRFCSNDDIISLQRDDIDEYISDKYGIIGRRGKGKVTSEFKFTSNNGIGKCKRYLGDAKFNEYTKFTNIRNPFSKMVSWFNFSKNIEKSNLFRVGKKLRYDFSKHIGANDLDLFKYFVESFEDKPVDYLSNLDKKFYCINGRGNPVIDFYLRQENYNNDMHNLCDLLGINFKASEIISHKTHYSSANSSKEKKHYSEYYNEEARHTVSRLYEYELSRFGYEFGD